MRKWTVCVLAALCVFGLFGCGAESVPALEKVKDYAPVDYEERFKGVTREALTEEWGEPADGGALQSADMWAIDDVSSVIIYWDADGSVQGGSIRPVEYHGRYEEDADICIIRSAEDMDDSRRGLRGGEAAPCSRLVACREDRGDGQSGSHLVIFGG